MLCRMQAERTLPAEASARLRTPGLPRRRPCPAPLSPPETPQALSAENVPRHETRAFADFRGPVTFCVHKGTRQQQQKEEVSLIFTAACLHSP